MVMYSKAEIIDIYRRRSDWYNFTANLYNLVGFREQAYRKLAVQQLGLQPGDTVVDLGCGTGLNFSLLEAAVGRTGKIIGVDLTNTMLQKARSRIAENGWTNIELIEQDMASFDFPESVQGVLSTFAYSLVAEHEALTQHLSETLPSGCRIVLLDLKEPERWPAWLVRLAVWVTSPFAVTLEYAKLRPWEAMQKYLENFVIKELFFGGAFIAKGDVP